MQQFWSEPFRPFFLLGWGLSLVGIGIWPLYFMGAIEAFPALTHAYLMIQGFFAAFAVGFLWTALPRMLEVPGPDKRWIGSGLVLVGGGPVLHLAGFHLAGHVLFLGVIALVAAFGIRRFSARRNLPPPSFVLVAAAVLIGAIGTILIGSGEIGWGSGFGHRLGRLFLMEVFLLLLVSGVAAFLAPRFLGKPSRQNLPTNRSPSRAWKKEAALAGAVAAFILAGAILQAAGAIRTGALLVAVPMTSYILYQVPIWSRQPHLNWMAIGMRIALTCSIAGPWIRLALPDARAASTHLLLLGGFGLLTLVVGARVSFGHSGYEHLFRTTQKGLGLIVGLYLASLTTRLAGEIWIVSWVPLLSVSALLLIVAHVGWGILVLPKILWPRRHVECRTNSADHLTIRAGRVSMDCGRMPPCAKR